jgi:hypothetical protein
LTPFQKLIYVNNKKLDVDKIKVGDRIFYKVKNAKDINIPNNGYWYKNHCDLDFIRDKEFIESRFLRNTVYDYYAYSTDDSYFVVRNGTYRGFPALILSDFRYNPEDNYSAESILKAVWKLARKSHFGIIYFLCGDINVDKLMKKRIHHKTDVIFISSYKISPQITYSLCGDSDDEFLKA